jgi:hypothetical protein
LEYAASLYQSGVDALIIQDLGFADLLKRYLPNMELHLSTQGTIYNMEGVKAAKKLNFSRAVLAREMNLDEIKSIVDENIYFKARLNLQPSLLVEDEIGNRTEVFLEDAAERAKTRALTEEAVCSQLEKTGGTPFRVKACAVEIEDDISIPTAKLNELRRKALEELELLRKNSKEIKGVYIPKLEFPKKLWQDSMSPMNTC